MEKDVQTLHESAIARHLSVTLQTSGKIGRGKTLISYNIVDVEVAVVLLRRS
jgi:hypothetical protein